MKSFFKFISEAKYVPAIAIYAGRFQPVHLGHKAVYDYLVKTHDVCYITTSGKIEDKSPLSFEEKKYLLTLIGIPANKIVQENVPYIPKNLFAHIGKTAEKVALIFGIGKKDMEEDPRFNFAKKKDGSLSYYQPYVGDKMEPADKHGYITTVPTQNFKLLGKNIKSASEVRAIYKKSDEDTRKEIIKELYGKFDQKAFEILNKKLG